MNRRRRPYRLAALSIGLALIASVGTAQARTNSVSFATFPRRLAQHDLATVVVAARPSGVVICTLSIRYADGRSQSDIPPATSMNGHAKFRFRVLEDAAPGRATVTAYCGRSGSARRSVLVVGSVIAARITVVKDGYSVRQYPYGGGTASYGVILKNTSPNQDALQVYTLVNFVGPDNKLVGSASTTVPGIPAGQQYALGGDLTFLGGLPQIARLEIVVEIQKRQAHALRVPSIANVYLEPSVFDPQWLGAVDGEVSNNEPEMVLENTQMSAVVFDAAGNVLGGGSGFAGATLPPAARAFFKLQSGFSAIPVSKAASAMVSAIGSYAAP